MKTPVVFYVLKRVYVHNSSNLSVLKQEKCMVPLRQFIQKLIFFFGKKSFLACLLKWKKNQFFRHNNPSRKISSYCSLSLFFLLYSDNMDVKTTYERIIRHWLEYFWESRRDNNILYGSNIYFLFIFANN